MLLIHDVMTELPVTIDESERLSEVAALMSDKGIRHLPVLRGGDLVGVLSERDVDIVRGLHAVTLDSVTAAQVMNDIPLAVRPETPLAEVVALMAEKRIGSALVAEKGQVLGIFTTVDALNALHLMCTRESTG